MSRKYTPLVVLLALAFAAVAGAGCVSLPVRSTSSSTGTPGVPIVQVETAVPPTAVEPTDEASPPATAPVATVAVTSTVAATPAATTAVETPAPATSATVSATAATPGTYRGPNPYRATPSFEVTYDPAVWEYVEDDGSGRQSQLKHRTYAGCTIWLRAGPVDAKKVADVFLAGRAWTLVQVQPRVIEYVLPQDDFAWIFGVILNEDFTGRANSACQDSAELVIDTFKVLPQ